MTRQCAQAVHSKCLVFCSHVRQCNHLVLLNFSNVMFAMGARSAAIVDADLHHQVIRTMVPLITLDFWCASEIHLVFSLPFVLHLTCQTVLFVEAFLRNRCPSFPRNDLGPFSEKTWPTTLLALKG